MLLTDLWGTPYYLAPEKIERLYGLGSDLWSAGVIMYMLVHLYPPYDGYSDMEIMENIVHKEVVLKKRYHPSQLDHEGIALLKGVLIKDPATRWTSARASASPWLKKGRDHDS